MKIGQQGSKKFLTIKNGKKQCTECKEWKILYYFPVRKNTKIGYNSKCKECKNAKQREYRKTSKGKISQLKYGRSKKGIDNYKKYRTSEKGKITYKKYRKSKKGQIVQKNWSKTKGGKRRSLCNRICNSIRYSLKGNKNGIHWEDIVEWTFEDFKIYMEPLFKFGMTWENHGEWHIDHIRPISSFNITDYDCDDFKKCWSLDNLQPLWASENIKKGNKWNEYNKENKLI